MRKSNSYKLHSSKCLKLKIIKILLLCIFLCSIIKIFPHFFRNTYIVTIAGKQVKNQNTNIQYVIYTQMEDGTIKAFYNNNSLLELKFNSEDLYKGLRINMKYQIKTYGFRITPISFYENITTVKHIK